MQCKQRLNAYWLFSNQTTMLKWDSPLCVVKIPVCGISVVKSIIEINLEKCDVKAYTVLSCCLPNALEKNYTTQLIFPKDAFITACWMSHLMVVLVDHQLMLHRHYPCMRRSDPRSSKKYRSKLNDLQLLTTISSFSSTRHALIIILFVFVSITHIKEAEGHLHSRSAVRDQEKGQRDVAIRNIFIISFHNSISQH